MNSRVAKIVFAGIVGGAALNLTMLFTFRLIGFGWNGKGVLLNPSIQSSKLIAVWTQIEPLPLIVSNPLLIITGLIFFAIGHAFIYDWLSSSWQKGIKARALRMALLLFFLSFLFWEFFTPFNQFGEPALLMGLQLLFWAVIAIAEALAIAAVLESRRL